jgi:SPP1 family predicted phage head-tail adaptor
MNAGLMDELISIQRYSETVDANTGEKLQTWTEIAAPWARIVELETGSEEVNADRRENKQTVNFTIRYDSNISVNDRIVWNSNKYNIISIADLERRMYIKLHTEISYKND